MDGLDPTLKASPIRASSDANKDNADIADSADSRDNQDNTDNNSD